jgi:hypothetical protein
MRGTREASKRVFRKERSDRVGGRIQQAGGPARARRAAKACCVASVRGPAQLAASSQSLPCPQPHHQRIHETIAYVYLSVGVWGQMTCKRAFRRREPRRRNVLRADVAPSEREFTERERYGYKRAAGGHGGLSLRRVLRVDGNKTCQGRPKQRRIRASHLCVCRVRPHANLQRTRGTRLNGRRPIRLQTGSPAFPQSRLIRPTVRLLPRFPRLSAPVPITRSGRARSSPHSDV